MALGKPGPTIFTPPVPLWAQLAPAVPAPMDPEKILNNASSLPEAKKSALIKLWSSNNPKKIELTLYALHDKDPGVRFLALSKLADTKSQAFIGVFVERLGDEDPNVQKKAEEALLSLGEEALAILKGVLFSGRSPKTLKLRVVEVLKNSPNPLAAGILVEAIKDEKTDLEVNLKAFDAVNSKMLDPKKRFEFYMAVYEKAPKEIKSLILKKTEGFDDEKLYQLVVLGLNQSYEAIKDLAREIIPKIKMPILLVRLFVNYNSDFKTRDIVSKAVIEQGKKATPQMLSAMKSEISTLAPGGGDKVLVYVGFLEVLDKAGADDSLFASELSPQNVDISTKALMVLSRRKAKNLRTILYRVITSREVFAPKIKAYAIELLGELKDPRDIKAFLPFLAHTDEEVRAAAKKAIIANKDEALPILTEAATAKSTLEKVRTAVRDLLDEITREDAK